MTDNTRKFARLEAVDFKEGWEGELAFDEWLVSEGGLELLGNALGMELEEEGRQVPVGPYKADVVCRDSDDSRVIIENQRDKSDHDHMGKLLTYAAGLDDTDDAKVKTLIWIAEKIDDEHRAALDWLNARTDDRTSFFGLTVELWRIGASEIAPKFNIICSPNEWVRRVAESRKGHSATEELRYNYWTAFKAYASDKEGFPEVKPVYHSHLYYPMRTGKPFELQAQIGVGGNFMRIRLYIRGKKIDCVTLCKELQDAHEKAGKPLGDVQWKTHARDAYIDLRETADIRDTSNWPEQHEWLSENITEFDQFFSPLIERINPKDYPPVTSEGSDESEGDDE